MESEKCKSKKFLVNFIKRKRSYSEIITLIQHASDSEVICMIDAIVNACFYPKNELKKHTKQIRELSFVKKSDLYLARKYMCLNYRVLRILISHFLQLQIRTEMSDVLCHVR